MAIIEHVMLASFNGNPNVGLYAFCTDKYCLVGNSVPEKVIVEMGKILKVPIHQTNIAGTPMLGAFCSGNSDCLLLPFIVFKEELLNLDRLGIKYRVIHTKLTALGNNILCNDHGCIVSPNMEESARNEIEEALGFKVEEGKIAGLDNVGSLAAVNSKRGLATIDASDSEIKLVEDTLKVKMGKGTLGMGVPYISSSLILNSNGFVVSEYSSGIEIADADSALGFLD